LLDELVSLDIIAATTVAWPPGLPVLAQTHSFGSSLAAFALGIGIAAAAERFSKVHLHQLALQNGLLPWARFRGLLLLCLVGNGGQSAVGAWCSGCWGITTR
jgi:hypothetical protein